MPVRSLDFQDGGCAYTCRVEQRNALADAWWWFAVSGDAQRYAPFRAAADDTTNAVRLRIAAYYREVVARRQAMRYSVVPSW
jgi:hypothetical protein